MLNRPIRSHRLSHIFLLDLLSSSDQIYNPDPLAELEPRKPLRHSYQELYRLPSKFMLNEDGRAPVTVIIHPEDYGTGLAGQIRAMLAQNDQPQAIWITTTEETVSEAQEAVRLAMDERVSMRIVDKQDPWFHVARQASSEFFLLMENGVLPGSHYLGTVLRLAHTPGYSRALLGSHGAVLTTTPENVLDSDLDIKCLPQIDSHGQVRATETVDVLSDIWFGRTEALELMSLEPWSTTGKAPLSIYLSTLLRYYGAIQSIVVANDPRNLATWGDTRTKDQPPAFCAKVQTLYKESSTWQSWIERGRALVSQHERLASLVVFLSSMDEAILVKDLICRWSLSPDLSVHVAVAGTHRGLGRKDFARLLPSEGCHVGVYDLKLSYAPRNPTDLESARLAAEVSVNTFHLINSLRPKVLFYLQEPSSVFSDGLDIAKARSKIPAIVLKPEDIEHVRWLPDLSVKALESKSKVTVLNHKNAADC